LLLLQLLYVAAIAVDATVAAVVAAVQLMLPGGVTATIVIATLVVTVSNVATITSRITHDNRDGGDCYCYFIDSCLVLFISHFNSFNNILHASSY
jgi:hypothetical protein